jgi:hypothetical protein
LLDFTDNTHHVIAIHGIEPHVTVFDKSTRKVGTFAREEFNYDPTGDVYIQRYARFR